VGRAVRTAVGASLLASALLLPTAAQVSSSAGASADPGIWVADHKTLKYVDIATYEVSQTYRLDQKPRAVAMDPTDGALWVLTRRQLLKLDSETNLLSDIGLRDLTRGTDSAQGRDHKHRKHTKGLDEAQLLALNPYDRSLWVAGERTLLHLDSEGALLDIVHLPGRIHAMALNLDESLWVKGRRQIWQVLSDGTFNEPFSLPEDIGALKEDDEENHHHEQAGPRHTRFLALDALGDALWLGNQRQLARINLNDTSDASVVYHAQNQTPSDDKDEKQKHDKQDKHSESALIHGFVVNPLDGTLWVVTKDELLHFDGNGNQASAVKLPEDIKKPEILALDARNQSLWLAGKHALLHFDVTGNLIDTVSMEKGVEAVGMLPFHLLPQLTWLEPLDGVHINNAAPAIRFGLGAICNGIPCQPGATYNDRFELNAALNDTPIGSLFLIREGEAVYQPGLGLTDATYTLTAQAIDAFGHVSNQISGQFTIDTVPPQFRNLQPISGTTVNQAGVTIQGQVNEPATVILAHPDGTTTVGSQTFAFSVELKPGLNSFTLLARDFAGNETQVSLQLTLATISIKIASPVTGTTANVNSVLVSGSFEGPANTGVTVNGVIAHAFGKQFFATVPLVSGENKLEARATSPDGATATDSVSVTSTLPAGAPPDPIQVIASPQSGIAPLTVEFTVSNTSGDTIQKIEIDVDGNGSTDLTTTNTDAPIEHIYATPGIFQAKSRVTDSTGTTHTATHTIVVTTFDAMDQMLRSIYTIMLDRLRVGDIEGALTAITGGTREKYEAIFRALEPNLATAVDQLGAIERIMISQDFAELMVVREKNGGRRAYFVYLLRSEDGVWRIESM
jgi:PKD repeat protein